MTSGLGDRRICFWPVEWEGANDRGMKSPLLCLVGFCVGALSLVRAAESAELPVWPGIAPGSEGQHLGETWEERGKNGAIDRAVRQVHQPTITVYLPTRELATGAAVLLAPGGGYEHVTIDKEGHDVARRLVSKGIAGIVLKYRLPKTPGAAYTSETSLADAAQALKVIREHAKEWGLDPAKVGMAGFSAGGNLAALAGTKLPKEQRPSFLGLIYASVPENFGEIPADTPPTFIAQANDDPLGTENALRFYQWMRAKKRSAELHLFLKGGHGFGLGQAGTPAAQWPELFVTWLEASGFVAKVK
jgi:endo-1,4-beta-xylanase